MKGALFPLLCGLAGAPVVHAGDRLELHVDPRAGIDDGARGSALEPLRTLTYALRSAGERGVPEVMVRLAPGEYRAGDGAESPGEVFPIRMPGTILRLALEGEPGAVIAEEVDEPLLAFELARIGQVIDVVLSGLEFRGGLAGACFDLGPGTSLQARVERCTFVDPAGKGIEVFLATGAQAGLHVKRSVFRGGFGGASFEGSESTVLVAGVEECTFESIGRYGPGGMLGAGIELHLEQASSINADILRNRFLGGGAALQLTSSELPADPGGADGIMEVRFGGNLVRGRAAGAPGQSGEVANAIYSSLHPHHHLSLAAVQNTFAAIDGRVLFHDNLAEHSRLSALPRWVFVNNIAWGIGADSEFDAESLPGFPGDWILGSNILEKSSLGAEGIGGNLRADPLFSGPDDQSLMEGSPARDRGDPAYAGWTDVDLAGRCRRASSECPPPGDVFRIDIGAFELPGVCDRETVTFLRGDCNRSGGDVSISDPIFTFGVLFLGTSEASCPDACDSDDDAAVDITDGVYILNFLFLGGPPPPAPFEEPGTDVTPDCLRPCAEGLPE